MVDGVRFGGARKVAGLLVALAVLLPVFAFVAASPRQASAAGTAATSSQLAQYKQWMAAAKKMYPYPQTLDKMYRVMMCESSGNPNAVSPSGTYVGLYQYARSTWRGSWNPYRNNSIWDAKSQIYATAKAWSIGMQSAWSCYYITWGR
jgi:Transglycosylase SLT domain